MSYDLLFFAPEGTAITDADILNYFRSRPHYKVNNSQVMYLNDDTGVYFSFDVGAESFEGTAEDGSPRPTSIVRFNLNYFRPHVFGLEAEPEVSRFFHAFPLTIHDPQIGGMGDGPYSSEAFLRAWNKGNETGYSAILGANGMKAAEYTMSSADIERYWRWNVERAVLQSQFGETLFVPKIMFLIVDGSLHPAVTWPDAIPTALPDVSLYVIGRREYAPRRFFARKQDFALASLAQVRAFVDKYPLCDGPIPYRLLQYDPRPAEAISWLRSLSPYKSPIRGVPLEKILNSELVRQYGTA